MAGPGEQTAGGRGHLRASHADREQVIGILEAAFVQGMLAKDEFDLRVGQTLASQTYADLAVLTADIPVGVIAVQPRTPAPATARKSAGSTVRVIAWGASVATPLAVLLGVVAFLTGNVTLFVLSIFSVPAVAGVAYGAMVELWTQKRSRARLPQGPAPDAGSQASRRLPPADRGRQLPPVDHTAEAVRKNGLRPPVPVRCHWADGALGAGNG